MSKYYFANKGGFHKVVECRSIDEAKTQAGCELVTPGMGGYDFYVYAENSDYENVRKWYGKNSDRTHAEFSDPIILDDGFFGDWEKRRIE